MACPKFIAKGLSNNKVFLCNGTYSLVHPSLHLAQVATMATDAPQNTADMSSAASHIPGIQVGKTWKSRQAYRHDGVHAMTQHGIQGIRMARTLLFSTVDTKTMKISANILFTRDQVARRAVSCILLISVAHNAGIRLSITVVTKRFRCLWRHEIPYV